MNVGSENTKQVRLEHDGASSPESPGWPRTRTAHCSTHTLLLPPLLHSFRHGRKVGKKEQRWGKAVILGSTACISPVVIQQHMLFTWNSFSRRQLSQLLNTAFNFWSGPLSQDSCTVDSSTWTILTSMYMTLPCSWSWVAACDLLLPLRGHTQCRKREHPAHPVWARDTQPSLQTAPKHPKAGLLETAVVEDDTLNCFQKERPLSALKSSTEHLWASPRGVQAGCVFLPVCSQLGLNPYPGKAFLGSFWPLGKDHLTVLLQSGSAGRGRHVFLLFSGSQQGRSRDSKPQTEVL